jgi:hypothetical protein
VIPDEAVEAAAVRAMEAVDAALDGYSKGELSALELVRDVARASGAYSVERIGW